MKSEIVKYEFSSIRLLTDENECFFSGCLVDDVFKFGPPASVTVLSVEETIALYEWLGDVLKLDATRHDMAAKPDYLRAKIGDQVEGMVAYGYDKVDEGQAALGSVLGVDESGEDSQRVRIKLAEGTTRWLENSTVKILKSADDPTDT